MWCHYYNITTSSSHRQHHCQQQYTIHFSALNSIEFLASNTFWCCILLLFWNWSTHLRMDYTHSSASKDSHFYLEQNKSDFELFCILFLDFCSFNMQPCALSFTNEKKTETFSHAFWWKYAICVLLHKVTMHKITLNTCTTNYFIERECLFKWNSDLYAILLSSFFC